ncbi:hypothetical protein E3N88_44764 [Mikania micrantha]|uniref:Uncharacterized protein n=1 Tax=Mikania micrantha TaxID=192012 RepID=A0A5N6LBB6_9ASTR|nr:hypothetical protein E3N88_44764 [Mikania micrantha]
MVRLGIEPSTKAYRMYDVENQRIVISRDVKFDEARKWEWQPHQNLDQEGEKEFMLQQAPQMINDLEDEPRSPKEPRKGDLSPNNNPQSEEEESSYSACSSPCLPDQRRWDEAMRSEIASIERSNTWKLIDLPVGYIPKGLKWVYKIKRDAKDQIMRHKARLVAKGCIQQQGVDYEEVFAPVPRLETVRLVLALLAQKGWPVHHLDVKTTFLHRELNEEVFVKNRGIRKEGARTKVTLDYYHTTWARSITRQKWNKDLSIQLCKKDIEDGRTRGLQPYQIPYGTRLRLIKEDGSKEVNSTEYRKAIGCLRYVKGTINLGMHYPSEGKGVLVGYIDSSYSADQEDGKGTTGVVFYFNNRPITWLSQKQLIVALSSCEAKLMAATSAACQAIWLRRLIAEITGMAEEQVVIKVNN